MALQKAVKSQSKLRMAIIGPAGSGKTYSALAIAEHLAGSNRVALFDTEHGSASKYSDIFDFDTDNIVAPFHPDKFCKAIQEAVTGNYGAVIIDSMSHAWNGEGGILDIVEAFAKRMKSPNSFAAWKDATPIQNRLTESILSANTHVIVTMRSKTEYVLGDDGRGKQVPRKVGMAPIQRENWDYEFDIVLEMDSNNNAIVTKTRCPALTGEVFSKPGKNVADILAAWLSSGVQPQPKQIEQSDQQKAQQPDAVDLVADIIANNKLVDPKVTQAWAVTNNYCTNAHHARNRMAKIVDDSFAGKVNPTNVKQVIAAFVAKCLAEGVQPEPAEAPAEPVPA